MNLLVFLSVLFPASTWSASTKLSVDLQGILSRNNEINSVEFVGSSEDGKSIFKDASGSLKTWQESRAFCTSLKLTMLTVTSKLQLEFLLNAYNEKKLPEHPWTSAREDREPTGMKWDNVEGKPNMTLFVGFGTTVSETDVPFQMCGVMNAYSGLFNIRPCTNKYYAVCQIPY